MRCLKILLGLCLLSCTYADESQELAAILHNDEEVHFNELEVLKNQIFSLQKQLEALQAKDSSLRSFLKEHLIGVNKRLEELSQKTIAAAPETITAPPPAPQEPPPSLLYNSPAPVATQNSWNVSTDASFIYWEAMQDNMELGVLSHQLNQGARAFGTFIQTDIQFRPGFKVGAGLQFNEDTWDLHAAYTWFRSQTSGNTSIPLMPNFNADYYQIWPVVGSGEILDGGAYTSVFGRWNLNMDLIDATLARAYHVGKKLIFHPYTGLRAALIRQKQYVQYRNNYPPLVHANHAKVEIFQNSNSWALGPEVGIDCEWTLYKGLHFLSSVEGDLLYTQYGRLHNSSNSLPNTSVTIITNTETDLHCLRAHTNIELGLGYGLYTKSDRCYFEFSTTYCFQAFFDQNMFHFWAGGTTHRRGLSTSGNLYIQGLTATIDFHF